VSQFHFVAYVRPEPQGSTKAFMHKGRPMITSANDKMKPYRHDVTQMALEAMSRLGLQRPIAAFDVPVSMVLEFYFRRPKSVKRADMTVKPDLDKLLRSTLDSLAGIVYVDDSQVVEVSARKHYGVPERVEVSIVC